MLSNIRFEEIGGLFGDEAHVASHWYGLSQEEKNKIAQEAMHAESKKIDRPSVDGVETEKSDTAKTVSKVEDVAA